MKYLVCFFGGMAVAFWISFWIESLNSEPREGILLFESFAWYSSIFFTGIFGFFVGRKK